MEIVDINGEDSNKDKVDREMRGSPASLVEWIILAYVAGATLLLLVLFCFHIFVVVFFSLYIFLVGHLSLFVFILSFANFTAT